MSAAEDLRADAIPKRGCRGCRRQQVCAEAGGLQWCAKCLGARKGSTPKRLEPVDIHAVPLSLQRAVGRVAWRVPFFGVTVDRGIAVLITSASFEGEILIAEGWTRGPEVDRSTPPQRQWTLAETTGTPLVQPRVVVPQPIELDLADLDDDGPAPIHGVCVGDRLTLDEEPIEVMGVDEQGFMWRTVATDARGRPDDEGEALWRELADEGLGRWRSVPSTPPKAPRAAKPRPAHLTPEPEADALAVRGQRCVVADTRDGGA